MLARINPMEKWVSSIDNTGPNSGKHNQKPNDHQQTALFSENMLTKLQPSIRRNRIRVF